MNDYIENMIRELRFAADRQADGGSPDLAYMMYNASIQLRKYATKLDAIRKLVNEKDEE